MTVTEGFVGSTWAAPSQPYHGHQVTPPPRTSRKSLSASTALSLPAILSRPFPWETPGPLTLMFPREWFCRMDYCVTSRK